MEGETPSLQRGRRSSPPTKAVLAFSGGTDALWVALSKSQRSAATFATQSRYAAKASESPEAKVSPTPRSVAERLAAVYGHEVDSSITYPTGVAFSGRLRLATGQTAKGESPAEAAAQIAQIAEPLLREPSTVPSAAPCLAVACFADELFAITGIAQHRDFLLHQADRFEADPDIRVEDFFFAGTLLGRAYAFTGEPSYRDRLVTFLRSINTRQPNGLYWHCHASPWHWGRGNAFAALGFAEALSCLHPEADVDDLLATHVEHLTALAQHQDESGLWRQLIDDRDTYLEHSATTMIGYTIARGLRRGWLSDNPWLEVANRAWQGAAERIGTAGELDQVCVGTGPLESRQAYVERPFTTGPDARGGAMALWFAVEMLRLQDERGEA